MAEESFEDLVENFELLDDWEDRYRYVIDLGRAMPPLDDALKTPATRVEGCASQVWLVPRLENGRMIFEGDSDAHIVRGLIAVLRVLYCGKSPDEILKTNAEEALASLDLAGHLSRQRSNGLSAMIARIQSYAASQAT